MLSWVTYSLVGKGVLRGLSPLVAVAFSGTLGAVCLLWPALGEGLLASMGSYPAVAWGGLGYLAIFGTVWDFSGTTRAFRPSALPGPVSSSISSRSARS